MTTVRCSFDRCVYCEPAKDGYLGICQRHEIVLDDAVQEILCGCPEAEWEEVEDDESV